MNQNIMILLVFVLVLMSFGTLAFAFSGSSGRRESKKRLEKVRERYSQSAAIQAARTRKLRLNDQNSSLDKAMKGLIPRPAELRKRLASTGKSISMGKYALTSIILMVVLTILMMVFGGFPFVLSLIVGFVGGLGLPHIVVGKMIEKRLTNFTKLFPDAIDLMVRGLRSGLPVSQSINAVAEEFEEPIGSEFHTIADKVRFGKTLEVALWETADRIPTPDFKFFVITLAIQRETGGNLAETLGNLSDILRKRQQLKLKIKAMSSEGKASAYIVGALPFLMFGVLLFLNYEYASVLFTDPRAIAVSIGALLWMGLGGFIMARMINFEI
ncbi:MAG: type II secretion system F family protein [Sphingomonadales bacterium]